METELKFELGAGAVKALVEHLKLATLGQQRTLRSVYYDTPKNALKSHHYILRVRDDGEDLVQTVKKSAAGGNGFRRGEWETKVQDMRPDLVHAEKTPLGDLLKSRALERLKPIFEVELSRIGRTVEVDGAVIEIVLDRGCVRARGRKSQVREIELELKSGPVHGLFQLARELAEVAPIETCFVSKSARGFALLSGQPQGAVGAFNPPLKPDETAGDAFQLIAGAALAQIAANARLLRAGRQPEALHQLRVGARRLRSAISLFKPMLAGAGREQIGAELKWLTSQLDEARDLDVFIKETFKPTAERRPDLVGLTAFGHALLSAQDRAYVRAQGAMNGARFRSLMLESLAWIEAGAWCDDPALARLRARPVRDVASERLESAYRKVLKRGRHLKALSPPQRHQLRIQAKKLRYACGFFGSAFGKAKDQRSLAGAVRDLQDGLGALNDAAVSHDLITGLAGVAGKSCVIDPKAAFAAGVILGEIDAGARNQLKAATKALHALRKAEAFW